MENQLEIQETITPREPRVNNPTPIQLSPEWHEARRGRVTASLAGAILGLSPFTSRDAALRALVRGWHGAPSEFTGNIATRYGVDNEASARLQFETEAGRVVEPSGFIAASDWAGCSPDGLLGEDSGLEIKCPFGARGSTITNPYPFNSIFAPELAHYYSQIAFSLWVTGRTRWWFYQWCPTHTRTEFIERDERYSEWVDVNIPKLAAFYLEFLTERELPAAEKHLAPARVQLAPGGLEGEAVGSLLEKYDALAETIAGAKIAQAGVLQEIVRFAGGQNADLNGRRLTLVKKPGAISYAAAIKNLLPGVDLESYRGRPTEYWVLSPNKAPLESS